MKKIFAVALVAAMLLSCVAFAEGVPSKTTDDIVQVTDVVVNVAEGAEAAEGFVVELQEAEEPADETVEAEPTQVQVILNEITATVTEQQAAPVTYFPEETQAAVAALLPEVDAAELQMNEYEAISIAGYSEAIEGAEVIFQFVTVYESEQVVVALVGVIKDGVTTWYVAPAKVLEDGQVSVSFTEEMLQAMNAADEIALAILSK